MMTTRAAAVLGSALLAAAVLVASCSSETPTGAPATSSPEVGGDAAARPEQALLEDLVVANRILARELDILDIQGHTSVRSEADPSHWYMPRYVSPGGAVVDDMIEYDLDSVEVEGPRTDNAREIYLHGEIYRARPDVGAIVHAHTPEFVAYGMSSVPLWDGDDRLPVWDIRPINDGRNGTVTSPGLGRSMAETLGQHNAVLLWGHGIALTGGSLAEAVRRVDALRDSAQLQQAAVAMGGTWTPRPRPAVDGNATARMWDYRKREVLNAAGGRLPVEPEAMPDKPSDPAQAAAHDVVTASRILAEELGILDAFGQVSMRDPNNPDSYFFAPNTAPGAVTVGDVVERDMTSAGSPMLGSSIHDEIYKARPDVNAVLYARTPEVAAFTSGPTTLRAIVNGAAFIGGGLPMVSASALGSGPILANPALGRAVAEALGDGRAVLLPGDGVVVATPSIYNLADQAYQLRQNAIIQRQAIGLRGRVTYLNERPAGPVSAPPEAPERGAPTGPSEGRSWVYWSQNVSLE